MKKILSLLLCLIFIFSVVSCEKEDLPPEAEKTKDTTPKNSSDEKAPYTFLSNRERLTWKDKIVTVLSGNDLYDDYEVLQHNFLGMALMDLNFDNTPELIAAYGGGSMGNVCLVAYDLESGERLCALGDTPHYQDWDNVYFCVHRNNDGNYILVNEGLLRFGTEGYLITSKLTEDFYLDSIFVEVTSEGESIRYYCDETEVDKAEFEKQKEQFENDYKAIAKTQLKMIYWDTVEAKTKNEAISEMADKLVNSDQQFIRFDIAS